MLSAPFLRSSVSPGASPRALIWQTSATDGRALESLGPPVATRRGGQRRQCHTRGVHRSTPGRSGPVLEAVQKAPTPLWGDSHPYTPGPVEVDDAGRGAVDDIEAPGLEHFVARGCGDP